MFNQYSSRIQKMAEKMIEEDEYFHQIRSEKSKLWDSQSLEASLYNEKDGKIAPRASDIGQCSAYNWEYMFKRWRDRGSRPFGWLDKFS